MMDGERGAKKQEGAAAELTSEVRVSRRFYWRGDIKKRKERIRAE